MPLRNNLKILFRNIFKAKWKISPPKKNKFVLVDGEYNPFLKYIKKKEMTILYRRGEEVNLYILFRCFLKFKFSVLDYCNQFIRHVSPKLILTAFDYHIIFFKLSKKTGIKTLMLQKGQRGYSEEIISNSNYYFPKGSKKKFHVDYVFLFNETIRKFYSKRISGNFFEIGSFENNFNKFNYKKNKKKEIVFISNYSHVSRNKCENEDIIAFHLYELAKKNNIPFKILPRYRTNPQFKKMEQSLKEEINFYKKLIKGNFEFILDKNKTSYELLSKYRFIFTTYSTLASELLAKGFRGGFIMFKSKKNPIFSYRFGAFSKLKNKGIFWTSFNKLDIGEIKRVFNFVVKSKNKNWNKNLKFFRKKIMNFDDDNKKFKKIIKNL
ncbi:LA_1612 family putative O-antigen biosynthesis protein [Candidatus Pelagibacter sp. HIMB1321]|uniref:LA_1612 family putative O-antigen biosynthesis protein n=1 Tax=Candidatus Pelagibacter sp. HIMB1321 TaxID=1388755 RepID=UPI000A081465|nr:LA_1612 family putative O-antigen biosynthesis protein [Candidatus Pelagibacter sp. HIMB1321]SMF79563.1 surface carbohydrate biosynthesis protein [Candidatus Pelagibacter sp. HIMB1321]